MPISIPTRPLDLVPTEATLARCSGCRRPITARFHLALETLRAASQRPATPEMLLLCGTCQKLYILSLRPALEAWS